MPHRCWSRRIDEQEWSLHSPLGGRELLTHMQFEKLAGGRAGIDTGDHTQRWRTSCDAGRRSSKKCKKGRICNHIGNFSAPGDHAGNGLAERAVRLVGGTVRTLKNELEFNCQIQIPPESKTIA